MTASLKAMSLIAKVLIQLRTALEITQNTKVSKLSKRKRRDTKLYKALSKGKIITSKYRSRMRRLSKSPRRTDAH